MLQIQHLAVSYGKEDVLQGISFTAEQGEWIGIIGRSGVGKSTLLRAIPGLISVKKGKIIFHGQNLLTLGEGQLKKARRKIAFIFQDYNLIDSLTVLENVLTSRLGYQSIWQSIFGIFSKEDYQRAQKAIQRVGLEEKILEKAKNLSGGQKQRVAIAKAICQDADIILADEPVSSLDPATTIQIMEYLKRIHEKKKKTIIINLHNVDLAKKYCQRILVLSEGNIIYDGPAGELGNEIIENL